jgi:hypothetical protein
MGILEVTTYPQRRVSQQMTDDLLLVYLDRGCLPEGGDLGPAAQEAVTKMFGAGL